MQPSLPATELSDKRLINSRYQLHELVGTGGMGAVYRATDRLNGHIVALKQIQLPPGGASRSSESFRLSLAHEFQTLAGLRHPHIISVLDYGFDAGATPFFTMRFLPAAQNILQKSSQLPFGQQVAYIQQLLQALNYLHRRGILHRDLKPDNVLISGDDLYVLDFGLALNEQVQQYVTGGTPLYMAPELLAGDIYSPAADLYAVGVIFYQQLTGRHPFAPFDFRFVDRVFNDEPDWRDVDPRVQPVLARLLSKSPTNRYGRPADVMQALARQLGQDAQPENEAIRESYLQAATFVGRQPELAQLSAALAEAVAGQGSAWLIGGESGVGKSRLIRELRTKALVAGCVVLEGQAVKGAARPYSLWDEPLRHLILSTPAIDDLMAGVLLSLIPDIGELIDRPVQPAPSVNDVSGQKRLLTTISALFQQQERPVLLILEDLQWVDESLEPLAYLQQLLPQQRLMIIGSYRDDEQPDLPAQLSAWHHLPLPRLSNTEMVLFTQSVLGPSGRRADILTLLQKESEGNTFFALEVMRALAEEAGQLARIGQIALPATIFTGGMRQILARRLSRLPDHYQPLLQLAAVAGRQIDPRLLSALQPEIPLADWLAAGHEAAVLVVDRNEWQFAHDKLREAVLREMSAPVRRQLHEAVAEGMMTLYGEEAQRASQLAHHWRAAGNAAQECHFALRAARYAAENYAHRDAVALFDRVLALLPADDPAARADVLLQREESHHFLGDEAGQKAGFTALNALPLSPPLRIRNLLSQARAAEDKGFYPRVIELAQEIIALAEPAGQLKEIATAHGRWGAVLVRLGDYDAALSHLHTSLAHYQRLADPQGIAGIHVNLGLLAFYQGRFDEAAEQFAASASVSSSANYLVGMSRALGGLGATAHTRGQYDVAGNYYTKTVKIAEQLGAPNESIAALNNLGVIAYLLGDYRAAEDYYSRTLALARQAGARRSVSLTLSNLGRLHSTQRAYALAEPFLLEGYAIAQEMADRFAECSTLNNLCLLRGRQGRFAEAQMYGEQAVAASTTANHRPSLFLARLGLVWARLNQNLAVDDQVEWLFACLADDPALAGAEHPLENYLLFYHCLIFLDDPRQEQILAQAHQLLQAGAGRIQDAQKRQMFLQHVPEHREILALVDHLTLPALA
ncbi:MAG: tetratricopeptide repeat protein [Anaerolineales bacterium]|nr:tetratricopeptide repeat protein [Anaerolineales bacterium]